MSEQQRIKDVGEVFTPQNIVNDMVDLLPDLRVETIVLESSVGEGVFLCEILRRKLNLETEQFKVTEILQTLYGIDIMLDNVRKTRENMLAVITDHYSLDSQFPENNEIDKWEKILQDNICWGDTLACYMEKKEDHKDIVYLKDLYREELKDLQFFNYHKNKWEKYIFPINEEIKQQRDEYKTRNKLEQTSLNFE